MSKVRGFRGMAIAVALLGALFSSGNAAAQVSPPADLQTVLANLPAVLDDVLQGNWSGGLLIWQKVPGQTGPNFAGVDNDGNGVKEDDQFALLQAVVNTVPAAPGLPGATRTSIQNAFTANRNYIPLRSNASLSPATAPGIQLQLNPVNVTALSILDVDVTVRTGSTTTIVLPFGLGTQELDVPTLWGTFDGGTQSWIGGVLDDANPLLDDYLIEVGAAVMTTGDTASIDWFQSLLSEVVVAYIPILINELANAKGAELDGSATDDGAELEDGDGQSLYLNEKYAINCANVPAIDQTLDLDGTAVRVRISQANLCSSLQNFINNFSCVNFTCQAARLSCQVSTGDLNADGQRNRQSHNLGSGNRTYFLAAECADYPNPYAFDTQPAGNVVLGVYNPALSSQGSWPTTFAMSVAGIPYGFQVYLKAPGDVSFAPFGPVRSTTSFTITGLEEGDNELFIRVASRCDTPELDSDVMVVRVDPIPVFTQQPPSRVSFVLGEGLAQDYVEATVSDSSPLVYQWYRKTDTDVAFVPYDGPNSDGFLSIPDTATVADAGVYFCRVTATDHNSTRDSNQMEVIASLFNTAMYDPYAGSGPLGSLIVTAKAPNDITIDTGSNPPTLTVDGGATFQGEDEDGVAVFRFDEVEVTTGLVTVVGNRPLSIVSAKDTTWSVPIVVAPGTLGGGSGGTGGTGGNGGAGGALGAGGASGVGGGGGNGGGDGINGQNGGGGSPGIEGNDGQPGEPGTVHASAAGGDGVAGFNDPNPFPGSGGGAPSAAINNGIGGTKGSGGGAQNTVGAGRANTSGNNQAASGGAGSTGNSGNPATDTATVGTVGNSGSAGQPASYAPEALAYASGLQLAAGSGGGGGSAGQGGGGGGGGAGGGGGGGGSGGGGGGGNRRTVLGFIDTRNTGGSGGGAGTAAGATPGPTGGQNGTTNVTAWDAVRIGGNGGGSGASGGNGGAGGNGGRGGNGGAGASGGGAVVLGARGLLSFNNAINVSAASAVAGESGVALIGSPGGNAGSVAAGFDPGNNGSSGADRSGGGGRGGAGGAGGAGSPGKTGGNGGAGGAGGSAVPGMVKLQGSVIRGNAGSIVANNAQSAAPEHNGIVTIISNMSAGTSAANAPAFVSNGAVNTGATVNDAVLLGNNPMVGEDTALVGELASGPAAPNGWLSPGFWNEGSLSFGTNNGVELAVLSGGASPYALYDQVFVKNTDASGTLSGVAVRIDGLVNEIQGDGFAVGSLAAGQVWTTTVPAGALVELTFGAAFTVSPDPLLVECPAVLLEADVLAGVLAIDAEDGDISASIIVGGDPLPLIGNSAGTTFNITYEVTDSDGLTTTATRVVEIVDTTPPVITGVVANTSMSRFSLPLSLAQALTGVSATDDCEGPLAVNVTAVRGVTPVAFPLPDGGGPYPFFYGLTYTSVDGEGNIATANTVIQVVNNAPPVITILGDNPAIVECKDAYVDAGATALDPEDGNLTSAITAVSTVDINIPNAYTVTYEVTDLDPIFPVTSQEARIVIVQDTTPPTLALNGPAVIGVAVGGTYTELGATASDICDSSLSVVIGGTVDVNTEGTYQLTYNVSDDSLNAAPQVTRTVEVIAELLNVSQQPVGANLYVDDAPYDVVAEISGGLNPGSYQWFVNGVGLGAQPVSGTTLTFSADPSLVGVGSYDIYVAVTDDIGTVNSDTVTVGVFGHVAIEALPDVEAIFDQNFQVDAVVTGGIGTLSYQWKRELTSAKALDPFTDGGNISGTGTASLVFTPILESDGGQYLLEVSDSQTDTVNSNIFTITPTAGVPVAGALGLGLMSLASALGGAMALRRRK